MTTLALKELQNTDLQSLSNEKLDELFCQLNSKLTECNYVIGLRLQERTKKTLFDSLLPVITDENLNNMSIEELGDLNTLLILILFKIKCIFRSRSVTKT